MLDAEPKRKQPIRWNDPWVYGVESRAMQLRDAGSVRLRTFCRVSRAGMPALIDIRADLRVRTLHGSATLRRSPGVCRSAGRSVGRSIAFLLLVLGPHLLSTQLVVVHGTGAMRPLHTLLLVGVHLSCIDVVVVVWVRVRIVVLLVALQARQAIVRRLPAGHRVRDMRAIVAAVGLLAVVRRWLQYLRRVVSRRRV